MKIIGALTLIISLCIKILMSSIFSFLTANCNIVSWNLKNNYIKIIDFEIELKYLFHEFYLLFNLEFHENKLISNWIYILDFEFHLKK